MRFFLPILLLLAFSFGCEQKKQPEYQGKSLAHWESEATAKKADQRRAAVKALGKIGPDGLPMLMKLLDDKNRRIRASARLAVMKLGPTAAPRLKELLRHPDKNVRTRAAELLVQVYVNMRKKGVRQLIKLLKNPNPNVRYQAAKAFMRIDQQRAREAMPALKEALGDDSPAVRNAAALTLKIIQKHSPKTFSRPSALK